jgi:hypothetical protein
LSLPFLPRELTKSPFFPIHPGAYMKSDQQSLFSGSAVLAAILLFAGLFFRVLRVYLAPETLPNFSPLMAAALCGAVFIPGVAGLVISVVALLISDALLNLHYGAPLLSAQMLWTLPCYLIAVGFGWILRERGAGLWPILGGTLMASLLFYLVTNTGSWLGLAAYPQNFAGWVQAMTTGLPGYPPTWSFLRNSLLGDLLFAALFVALEQAVAPRKVAVIV